VVLGSNKLYKPIESNFRLFVKDWGHGALEAPPCPL